MLLSLVQEQTRRGMDPMILSAGAPGIEEKALEKEAVRLRIPVTPWRMKPGLNIRESWKILKWAQLNGYQILHSHGFKFNVLLGMIPRLLRKLPMVVTLHGYVHAKRFSKLWVYEVLDRVANVILKVLSWWERQHVGNCPLPLLRQLWSRLSAMALMWRFLRKNHVSRSRWTWNGSLSVAGRFCSGWGACPMKKGLTY